MAGLEKANDWGRIKALTSPKRQQIIEVFLSQADEASVSPAEIARTLGEPLGNISYHVRVLAECGVIELKKLHPVRGSVQHFYSMDPQFIKLPWVRVVLASFSLSAA